jgi:glycine cleavage system H protein
LGNKITVAKDNGPNGPGVANVPDGDEGTQAVAAGEGIMTFLLVLLFFAVVLLVEVSCAHRRRVAESRETVADTVPPHTLVHRGHTWLRYDRAGHALVGATDFAANFAGEIAAVELPREGRRLGENEPAWTLVSARNRRLTLAMPIAGTVVAVNYDLLRNPGLAQRLPYSDGWFLRIRPRDASGERADLKPLAAVRDWIDNARAAVMARLSPSLGSVAFDGGGWAAAFGDRLEEDDWQELKRQLFPVA